MEKAPRKQAVSDLGVAAYLRMHGYRIAGKRSRNIYFFVTEDQQEEFDNLQLEYLQSNCFSFDSHLCAIKKLPEYVQDK